MISRNEQKLQESKRILEVHTENVETREKLILNTKSELQKIEAFIHNHEREQRDTERNRAEAQSQFVEIEKKYTVAKAALEKAKKAEHDSASHPTYLQQQHKRDEALQNIKAYEQELRYQKNQAQRAANDLRTYERAVKEETNELMRRAKQDVANDNRKPQDFRRAA